VSLFSATAATVGRYAGQLVSPSVTVERATTAGVMVRVQVPVPDVAGAFGEPEVLAPREDLQLVPVRVSHLPCTP
jgi:hypothetical protein